MTHNMKLNSKPFEMIKKGYKTFELRLNDEKRRLINIEDMIIFTDISCPESILTVKVVALHRFKSFDELYKELPLDKCGYLPDEIADATSTDMEKYYTVMQQRKYGVLAIGIELME